MTPGVGQRIRKHRLAADKTLQQVADACGCTKAYLSQVERFDQEGRLSAELALGIAKCLSVPVAALMDDETALPTTAEDLAFFRRYCALPQPDKARFRQVCQLMRGCA
jgi:transcriptional regulator with XRE-family HTH domain